MNKRVVCMALVLSLILLFVSINIYSANYGTCFDPAIGACDYINLDTEDCDTVRGNIFYPGEDINEVPNCIEGCCCGAKFSNQPIYPIKKGQCEITFESMFLDVNESECNTICSAVNQCKASCQENTQDCVGRNGRTIDVDIEGKFYCWERDSAYLSSVLCNAQCTPITTCDLATQIASDCYCSGKLYSSGFCCWDNSYDSNTTGASCPAGNDCEKHEENGQLFKCCDACADTSLEWDEGSDVCQLDYGIEKGLCCPECAPDYKECCPEDWQCASPMPAQYNYFSCPNPAMPNGKPCGVDCIKPICILNERINSGANTYPRCICGGNYYCTGRDASVCSPGDSRYCCGGISDLPCGENTFNLTGFVYNKDTGKGISDAYVGAETSKGVYSAMTNEMGEYFIEGIVRGTGFFNVSVIKEQYYPEEFEVEYPTPARGEEYEDFNITSVEGYCDQINPPAVTKFNANPVKGKKEVNLTWENPCSIPSKVLGYFIRRVPRYYLGTLYITGNSFIDDNVSWGRGYTYSIKAIYVSGRESSETNASITMGNSYCEEIFSDEQFCLDNTLGKSGKLTNRYKCDEDNNLELVRDCSSGYVCAGPDTDGYTYCRSEINCKDNGNPFGLFYVKDSCLGGGINYCSYDYSYTTVDECRNCNEVGDCYNYRSEDACLADSCLIHSAHLLEADSYKNPCKWVYTFEEFGKGICYDEDYNGVEHCGLCNKDSSVFNNIGCDQNMCTKLGSCYSKNISCEQCLGNTRCEDFDNEESCVNAHLLGSRNIEINNCQITRSDDACGLGACKWGDVDGDGTSSCFKDADDDITTRDCVIGEVGCEDFEPFTTVPQADIPKINSQGYDINFSLTGGGIGDLKAFYFCVDRDNSCCPADSVDVSRTDRNIIINPVEDTDAITDAGNYFIRYYSVDTNYNVEEVKSTEFFADIIGAKIVFGHFFYSDFGHNYTKVVAVSDKYVNCNYTLNEIPADKVKDTNFGLGFNNSFFMILEDLDEGNYILTTICNDIIDNSVRTDYTIDVNRVYSITIGEPDGKKLNSYIVKFHLTSTDNSVCSLEAVDASASGIPYHPLSDQPVGMDKVELIPNKLYNYTKTLALEQNVSYIVRATCRALIGQTEDSGFFHFTIDKQPPVTSTDFDFSKYHKLDPVTGLLTIKFDCNDPKINGVPGEAGCEGVYLCTGINCYLNEGSYVKLINDEYQTDIDGLRVSYFSVDNLGNKEDRGVSGHYNQLIRIDKTNPTVSISSPTELITNSMYQEVRVIAGDDRRMAYVGIKIEHVDPVYLMRIANATKIGTSTYRLANAQLYNGMNLITATACDEALNCEQDTHQIYYDVYGPTIGNITIHDSDFDVDSGNLFEKGEDLLFDVIIEDKYVYEDIMYKYLMYEYYIIRYGIGVNPAEVMLTIFNSGGEQVAAAKMVAGEQNYYTQNITTYLPVGTYTATVEAYDYYGNKNSRTASFEIEDTMPPILILVPELPSIVYVQSYYISGITEPDLSVRITILNGSWQNPRYSDGTSNGEVLPKDAFKDKRMGDLIFNYQYPLKGDNLIMFKGDWSAILFSGDYLEFSNHYKIPRYQITDRRVIAIGFNPVTQITINPPLEENVDSAAYTVSAFTSAYPSGWFNIPVQFEEGMNNVMVSAIGPSGPPADLTRQVVYDTSLFDVVLINPSDSVINYNDFSSTDNSINLQIRTEEKGVDFRANCKISHVGNDIIAEQFKNIVMSTTDNVMHTFTINSLSCKERGGYYCLIGGTSEYPINYHHYQVNCTPIDEQYAAMGSRIESICFTVATYGMQTGSQERGVNICQNSVGCGSIEPSPCSGAINCNDVFHDASQGNCVLEGFCKWSEGYGCDESCYFGFVDGDGDGVCTIPSINCADYNGNRNNCLSMGACKWCPSTATSNANKCLQGSCSDCGGFLYDSGPLDGECDKGGEGIGGWRRG